MTDHLALSSTATRNEVSKAIKEENPLVTQLEEQVKQHPINLIEKEFLEKRIGLLARFDNKYPTLSVIPKK
jgi:hypothetical protein